MSRGIHFIHDEAFLDFKKLIRTYPYGKFFVLSHAHVLKDFSFHGRRILITDTWRNEYNLVAQKKKEHTYADIFMKNQEVESMELKIFSPAVS